VPPGRPETARPAEGGGGVCVARCSVWGVSGIVIHSIAGRTSQRIEALSLLSGISSWRAHTSYVVRISHKCQLPTDNANVRASLGGRMWARGDAQTGPSGPVTELTWKITIALHSIAMASEDPNNG